MIIKDGWKLYIPYTPDSKVINALHDLNTDPYEMTNLLAGEPDAAISHNGVHTLFHLCHFTVETDCLQILLRIVIIAQQYIVTDTVIEQLRIMSQVSYHAGALRFGHFG